MVAAGFGYWAHTDRPVQAAADPSDLRFQFGGFSPDSALTVYSPGDQSLYVYQHAAGGFSTVQCSFRFHVPRPGAPIERSNCPVGSFRP